MLIYLPRLIKERRNYNLKIKMQSDDEKDEDEEEILVYVEFEGFVGSNVFNNEALQLDMIGIDTEHPIMQINGRVCAVVS